MIFLDRAGLYGLDERMESVETRDYRAQLGHLQKKEGALLGVQAEGMQLLTLFEAADRLRLAVRNLNPFLTALMEGRIRRGTNDFSDFLINLTRNVSLVPRNDVNVLDLSIVLLYGDNQEARALPLAFAKRLGWLPDVVRAIEEEVEKKEGTPSENA